MDNPRSSIELRETLFDTLDELREDKCSYQKAQAVGKLASQIVNSMLMEIEYFKAITKFQRAGDPSIDTSVSLTGPNRISIPNAPDSSDD